MHHATEHHSIPPESVAFFNTQLEKQHKWCGCKIARTNQTTARTILAPNSTDAPLDQAMKGSKSASNVDVGAVGVDAVAKGRSKASEVPSTIELTNETTNAGVFMTAGKHSVGAYRVIGQEPPVKWIVCAFIDFEGKKLVSFFL